MNHHFIGHALCARHCGKCFTDIISFNPHVTTSEVDSNMSSTLKSLKVRNYSDNNDNNNNNHSYIHLLTYFFHSINEHLMCARQIESAPVF